MSVICFGYVACGVSHHYSYLLAHGSGVMALSNGKSKCIYLVTVFVHGPVILRNLEIQLQTKNWVTMEITWQFTARYAKETAAKEAGNAQGVWITNLDLAFHFSATSKTD